MRQHDKPLGPAIGMFRFQQVTAMGFLYIMYIFLQTGRLHEVIFATIAYAT